MMSMIEWDSWYMNFMNDDDESDDECAHEDGGGCNVVVFRRSRWLCDFLMTVGRWKNNNWSTKSVVASEASRKIFECFKRV